ncbi:MAG TPA: WYL domain-containing protein [Gemmatimonadaceae bacterium]|nr:WYL domain-containing protein [Gemmatimonadaceae bacterium]
MADTAASQLRRLLDLIPRFADGEEHPIAEVAQAAGTSAAELMADIYSLSERFDEPGGFVSGVSIFVEDDSVSVHASHFHRPMRLLMSELCALELGLMLLRRQRTPAEQPPIERALARLRETISQVPANERWEGVRYAELAGAGSAEHLAALRTAVRECHEVRLRYRAGGAADSTTRVICPHSLVFAEQAWYVVATGDDGTMRFFRLDRVEGVTLLDGTFERDESIPARVQETGRAFASATSARMRVRYAPRIARWVAEREGHSLDADGSLTVEHPVADESWAVRHVLQYGPDAEVLAPAELREKVRDALYQSTAILP